MKPLKDLIDVREDTDPPRKDVTYYTATLHLRLNAGVSNLTPNAERNKEDVREYMPRDLIAKAFTRDGLSILEELRVAALQRGFTYERKERITELADKLEKILKGEAE